MAYAALVSLAQTTDLILNPLEYSISVGENKQITSIREYVIFLITFLEDFPRKANRLEGKIRCVANEAEDLIEYSMWKQIHDSWWSVRVSRALFEEQLNRAREEFCLITGDMMDDRAGGSPAAAISSSRLASTGKNDVLFGLDEELIALKLRLCGESSKLEVIPILGMGGIGKTTLARCAYDDQLTVEHFHIRAWVTISQDYSAREILSCLLDTMKSFDEQQLAHADEATMRDKVYKSLRGRRYLILMDDVWSTKVLDDVRNIFPNDRNGSRIMLTTRLSGVATYVVSGSPVHEMKFMDDVQCWKLLKQKVSTDWNDQGCPSELEDVGKEIARRCRGLPLAVVLVAGILSKMDVTLASWEEISKNLNSIVGEQIEEILSLSYIYLPHNLRSCFMYVGGFPEDHEVRVSELIKMWVAEGFLKCTNEFKSLEEEAEEYLENLVERSLVLVTNRKSNGKIKSCSLHDLVRDLSIRKAREENFLVHAVEESIDTRRLSITNSNNLNDICGSTFRTILCFQQLEASSAGSLDFLERSKLVRVLGMANGSSKQFHSQIFELFHLRYLALRDLIRIPSTIYKLQNLQTLIIKPKAEKYMREFRLEICRMPQLRHIVVYFFNASLYSAHESTLPLENLQTLSGLLSPLCSEEFLKMFPNVKKLGLIFDGKKIYERVADYQLYNLARVDKLEELKVTINNFSWVGQNLVFPRTLKKLTLSGMRLPWKDMTIVGSLPNLEVLKLLNRACDGDTWETVDGGFPQLKLLLIERSTLQHWITEYSHFQRLKCLILRNCQFLMQIPDGIGEIPSLEMIEVDFINKSLVDSAKEIQKDQKIYWDNDLQVCIIDCHDQSNSFEKTSGKMCYMIRRGQPETWQWKPCADSRFLVAEFKEVDFLNIRVTIKMQILSPNTIYAAYLVFKLAEEYSGNESAHAVVSFVRDEYDFPGANKVVHLQQRADAEHGPHEQSGEYPVERDKYPVHRHDGWMEVEMGSFFNDGVDDDGEAVAKLWPIADPRWKSGLIILGIEFRPEKFESQIISFEKTSGKKCYMIGARELEIEGFHDLGYWGWKHSSDSRFSVVAELKEAVCLDIRVIIKTHILSSNTTYAAYLVYKLAEECYGLESAYAVIRHVNNEDAEETVVHLQQRGNDDDDDDDGRHAQNGTHPVGRNDGWMEVEMGSFFSDGGEVVAKLFEFNFETLKSGLIIEGIECRPKVKYVRT